MRKKRISLFLICVSLLVVSFFISTSQIVDVGNYSIQKNYSTGDVLSGNFTLNLTNVSPNSVLRTNLGHSILLRDFLKNNSKPFDCESFDCEDRYTSTSEGSETKEFQISSSNPQILGIKYTGMVQNVNDFQMNIKLNFEKSSIVPLSINFGDDSDPVVVKYQNPSNDFSKQSLVGINNLDGTDKRIVDQAKYCQKFNFSETKRVLVGANITGGSAGNSVRVELRNLSNSLGDCTFQVNQTEKSCIINLTQSTESKEYFVCITSQSNGIELHSKAAVLGQGGGYFDSNLFGDSDIDYSIFAKVPKYEATNNFIFLINDSERYVEEKIISYLRINYPTMGGSINCSEGCIFPIVFSGLEQNLEIVNVSTRQVSATGNAPIRKVYDLEKIQTTSNFQGEVKLEKAGFVLTTRKDENLKVYLEDNGEEIKLFEEKIKIISVPMVIRNFYPLSLPAGVPVVFIADVFSTAPITSYIWSFGDGTTKTTANGSVLKTYDNITTYNLTLKVTNNVSQQVERNFSIETINPRDYINNSLEAKMASLNKIKSDLGNLTIPFKTRIEQRLNLEQIRSELNSIDAEKRTSTTEEQFLNLALRIHNSDVPQAVWIEEEKTEPFITNFNLIDLSIISNITGKSLADESYKNYIANWEINNVQGTKKITRLVVLNRQGVKENLAVIYEIKVKSDEKAYLVVQGGEIEFSQNVQKSGGGNVMELNKDQQKQLDLISFQDSSIVVYVSPDPSNIELVDPSKIGICNYNNKCEPNLEENWKNCRHDCRPWPLIIGFLIGVLVLTIIAYTFIQIQFKRRYELSLFNSKQELNNLVESITNSKENKLSDKEITDKLIKNGWSKEQISYAIKKSRGEKTRPYEIIPIEKIMKSFENKPVKNLKNEKHIEKTKE